MRALIALLLATLLLSALLVAVTIAYARHRGLLDRPGQRRLHRVPTPRGGGAGLIAAFVLAVLVAAWLGLPRPPAALTLWLPAVLLTALLGARDDHGGLGILPRLGGHLLAAALLLAGLWPGLQALGMPLSLLLAPLAVLALAWSLNLHNFMDGSDGLLGMQALLMALAMAALAGADAGVRVWALLLAAAVAGFLPFNLPLPRARVFMGDVGSGTLGLLLAGLALAGVLARAWPLPVPLLLASAFVADAGFTLAWRMLRGRRWWRPHREHLYQWLARSGGGHARPLLGYLGWNLLLALPAACLAQTRPALGWWLLAAVYMLAGALWWQGKRACWRRLRSRPRRWSCHAQG